MKILKIIFIFFIFFLQYSFFICFAKTTCKYDIDNGDIKSSLINCMPEWSLENKTTWWWKELAPWITVWWSNNQWYSIDSTKNKLLNITQKIVITWSLLAIWWIVFAWILFVIWLWNSDKTKKAKDALKWSLIWFVATLGSQQLINAIINFIYGLSN